MVYIYCIYFFIFILTLSCYIYIYIYLVLIANNLLHCFLSTQFQSVIFHTQIFFDFGCCISVWPCYTGSILESLVDLQIFVITVTFLVHQSLYIFTFCFRFCYYFILSYFCISSSISIFISICNCSSFTMNKYIELEIETAFQQNRFIHYMTLMIL